MGLRPINIAVSGLNATDNPGPGVPVIRSIRESSEFEGVITGFAYDVLDPGVYMQGICDNVFLMPYPSQGAENLLEAIRSVHSRFPVDVIIPTLDSELRAYIDIEPELRGMGIHTFLPSRETLELRSKSRFHRLTDISINVPKGKQVTSAQSLYGLPGDFTFPVMVKGQFYEAYQAHSVMEAASLFERISSKWGLPVMIQEFITGPEYDVVAVGDGNGALIGAVPMRKMQLTNQGKAWGGITIYDPAMDDFVRDVMGKLKWRGPCEFEIIKERQTGKFFLIEINPRFPAWCYLAVGAGQNLPWATVRLALGESVESLPHYSVGTLFLRNSVDQIYPLAAYQRMATTGELIRVGRGVECHP